MVGALLEMANDYFYIHATSYVSTKLFILRSIPTDILNPPIN